MSALSLRLPDSLHAKVRELAERDGVSINQFVTTAVAEKLAALATEEYITERAARGSRAAFRNVLARVPDKEPDESDKLR
jgi:HicB family.